MIRPFKSSATVQSYRRGVELARHAAAVLAEVRQRGLPAALEAADSAGIRARKTYARALLALAEKPIKRPITYQITLHPHGRATITMHAIWLMTDYENHRDRPTLRRFPWRGVETDYYTAAQFALKHQTPVAIIP